MYSRRRLLQLSLAALASPMLEGCTVVGVVTSGISHGLGIGTSKYGWFDANSSLAQIEEIKKPVSPLNLTIDVRYIFQGYDTDAEGSVEQTLDWAFSESLTQQFTDILESSGIALINDRGMDGELFIEVSNRIEWFGQRYIPFLSGLRLTEEKLGRMRITLKNRKGDALVSDLVKERVFVQSGLFSDHIMSEDKQAVFDVPRVDYTVEGETVALKNLNEQLFLQTLRNLQDKADLESFFATAPEDPISELIEGASPDEEVPEPEQSAAS